MHVFPMVNILPKVFCNLKSFHKMGAVLTQD